MIYQNYVKSKLKLTGAEERCLSIMKEEILHFEWVDIKNKKHNP